MKKILNAHATGALLLTLLLWGSAGPESPVADAAMRGDLDVVRELLERGADVNLAQGDGMTALHWAGEVGDAAMAEMLIYAGANIDAFTRLGDFTPLLIAAEAGNGPVVQVLVEAGADVEARTAVGGATALHYASQAGSVVAVETLLDAGADPDVRQTAWGQTPLMFAASLNRVEALQLLLDRGADPWLSSNVLNLSRRAVQDKRAGEVRTQVLAALREAAGDPVVWNPDPAEVQAAVRAARDFEALESEEAPEERIDWEQAQTDGTIPTYADRVGHQGGLTPLLHAVREGHFEATKVLLDAGANVD